MNQANGHLLHQYMNNLNELKHIPLGYTRTLINKTFIKTLVDSGNLFGTICSENLAKRLNLPITPCSLQAGTAVSGQTIQVIDKSEPFFIILENIDKPIVIAPIVVKNLSHDLNLGEAFLRGEKAELKFNNGTVSLKIDKCTVELMDKNAPLVRNSDDKRFADVMLADKAERYRINNCHEYKYF